MTLCWTSRCSTITIQAILRSKTWEISTWTAQGTLELPEFTGELRVRRPALASHGTDSRSPGFPGGAS